MSVRDRTVEISPIRRKGGGRLVADFGDASDAADAAIGGGGETPRDASSDAGDVMANVGSVRMAADVLELPASPLLAVNAFPAADSGTGDDGPPPAAAAAVVARAPGSGLGGGLTSSKNSPAVPFSILSRSFARHVQLEMKLRYVRI